MTVLLLFLSGALAINRHSYLLEYVRTQTEGETTKGFQMGQCYGYGRRNQKLEEMGVGHKC